MKDECEKYRDLMIREDLGGAEKTGLEAHLSDCSECATFAAFLSDVEAELSAIPEVTPDIVSSVMKVVRRTALSASPSLAYGQRTKNGGFNLWPLAGVAALFALIISGLGLYIAFGGGEAQLINSLAFLNIQTITVATAIVGSVAVAAMAFIYSRIVSVGQL